MRVKNKFTSLLLCILSVLGAFSLSSFAVYFPFVADYSGKNEEISAGETALLTTENITDDTETAYTTLQSVAEETEGASENTGILTCAESTSGNEPLTEETRTAEKILSANGSGGTGISLNGGISASLSSEYDIDDYVFTVSERGVLKYSVERTAAGDMSGWVINLYQQYNSNGYDGELEWRLINVLTANSGEEKQSSPNIGLQKGVYKLSVSSSAIYTSAKYTLSTSFTPGTDYEIEYNDTASRYTEITPGAALKGSACRYGSGSDTDYYMFRVYSNSKVKINFAHDNIDTVSAYWKISLLTSTGEEIYSDNSFGTDKTVSSGETGLPAGCYFIKITGRVYTDIDYTLSVERDVCTDFETELNGSFLTADSINLSGTVKGALTLSSDGTDTDIFVLDIDKAGFISIDFSIAGGKDDNYSHRIMLVDKNGSGIWEEKLSQVKSSVTSANIGLGVGRYYIKIDNSGLYGNSCTYTLITDFSQTSGWEKEYNNTVSAATPITSGTEISGTIINCEAEFDDDYYSFTVTKPAMISLCLNHEKLEGGNNIFVMSLLNAKGEIIQLEDENGEKLVSENSTSVVNVKSSQNDENVYGYYTLPAGTYYIRVTSGLYVSDIRYNLTYTLRAGG